MCKLWCKLPESLGAWLADLVQRLAQARTGTGKTLAFLIPVLQNIITVDPQLELRSGSGRSGSSTDIRALIISPTRELAEQIAVEAKKVTRNTGVIVQTAVGGSQKSLGLRRIREQGCHILVGTPGRLNDILSDPYSKVRAPNLSAFVLDEADRLLDQGFAPDIATIQDALPDRKEVDRQTLLFSATVPREVMSIVRKTMKPDFKFVRTVQEGEQQTHEKVVQKLVNVRGMENFTPALVELCQREISQTSNSRPFKAIVYFGATADVSLTSSALLNLKDPEASVFHNHLLSPAKVIEIHAKLDQHQRTRAAETFRNATSAIMLSSDVTARGMDFPGVTHVIQIGLPPSEEQYVHRIGRTARGQNTGEGWLLVSGPELREAHSKLRSMPLIRDETLETAKVDMTKDAQLSQQTAKILTQVGEALRNVPRGLKAQSYMAGIGLNAWQPSKQGLIDALNNRAKYGWGMTEPPKVGQGLVQKLSLSRCVGLNIGYEEGARSEDRGRVGRAASPRGRFGSSTGGGFERGGREGGHNRLSQSGDGQGFRGRFTNPRASERDGDRFQRRDKEGRYGGRGSYRGRESRSLER